VISTANRRPDSAGGREISRNASLRRYGRTSSTGVNPRSLHNTLSRVDRVRGGITCGVGGFIFGRALAAFAGMRLFVSGRVVWAGSRREVDGSASRR